MTEREELEKLLRKSAEAVSKMSPEEYADMVEKQKASWVRGMTQGCEHGVLDFETCPKCKAFGDGD